MRVFRIGRPMAAGILGVLAAYGLMGPQAATAQAQADATAPAVATHNAVSFDIPAQSLAAALSEYARQSGQQLLFAPEIVEGKQAPAVSGELHPREALDQVLVGAGLYTATTPGGAILISDTPNPKLPASDPSSGGAFYDPGVDSTGDASGTTAVEVARRRGVEEIIVTGQKRAERLQDVPIAISAFTMEDLTTSQIAGGADLHLQVPNMTFTKTNFSGYSIQIRGIGTQAISATTDPAVAVALNNTPFVRNRFFEQEFFDLERLEVLRGPQGTLYGRNATAGVVNLISAKPKFDHEAKLSYDLANYGSSRIEGMLNIPVVEDAVAFRLAGAATKRDGFASNRLTGSPIDGRDLWSTRASLRLAPSGSSLDVNLIWEHFEEDDDRLRSGKQLCTKDVVESIGDVPVGYLDPLDNYGQSLALFSGVQATLSQGCKRGSLYSADAYQTPNGLMLPYYLPLGAIGLPQALTDPYASSYQSRDLRSIDSTVDPLYAARSDIGELQIKFDLTDTLVFESESAYSTDYVYSLQDFNRFNTAPGAWEQPSPNRREGVLSEGPNGGIFCDPQLGCSDRLVAVDVSTAESEQISQEFRISSQFAGPFNFSFGGNYLRYNTEDKYYVFFNSVNLIAADPLTGDPGGPYVPGISDNTDCLLNGYAYGDPDDVYAVGGCNYIDPNPIANVNDKGHNYFLSRNPFTLRSYALFGETYLNIADNLKLTVGARWSVDRKSAPRIPSWLLASGSYGYPIAEVIDQEWREPTGRIVLDWKPQFDFTDETLIYGSVSRGYKAGGANPPGFVRVFYADDSVARSNASNSATRPLTFDAEYVNAFEVGTKNTLADGAITLNMAAFYYDYEGYQVSEIVDRSAFNRNFDVAVWGTELELDWWLRDNLRFGFKGGYQKTRIDDSESAVDLMDRTAGNDDWVIVRPFPTFASSCILPLYMFDDGDGSPQQPGGSGGGNPGGCEIAYQQGLDPLTEMPYVPNPGADSFRFPSYFSAEFRENYAGFDPSAAPNGGEGFSKSLGGNELPNAPNYTATLTGDLIVPLKGDWLATLHTDIYWQSESWWRVFNDHEFGRLDDYFTMNVAAIFTHPSSGWNIMAYVKNVTDETAITGAFLNSDDTGLTTNTFLTEPRLYGLRVTKSWADTGTFGRFITGRGGDRPWPISLTLGGQVYQVDAPTESAAPSFISEFDDLLALTGDPQKADLGWGGAREIALRWHPSNGPWSIGLGYRAGRIAGSASGYDEIATDPLCVFAGGEFSFVCDDPEVLGDSGNIGRLANFSIDNHLEVSASDREAYELMELVAAIDRGTRSGAASRFTVGIRKARFTSSTAARLQGVPDWFITDNLAVFPGAPGDTATHTTYDADLAMRRTFEGVGPIGSWASSQDLKRFDPQSALGLEWELSGGVLFGDHTVAGSGRERARQYETGPLALVGVAGAPAPVQTTETDIPTLSRESADEVPFFGASLGLAYTYGAMHLSGGYRWERYVDVIDGGFTSKQTFDRTLDGPFLKVTFGPGGQD